MPKIKKTHQENLATVCCVCGRKGGTFRNVTESVAEMVKLLQPSYNRQGGTHPTAICDSCRKACSAKAKKKDGEPDQTRHRVPSLLDYSAIRPPGVPTRSKPDCTCSFCEIGALGVNEEKKHNNEISNPLGRPAGEEMMETDATLNLNISIKICQYCKAELRQGVKHVCNQTERRRNIANQLKSASRGTLETVTGEGLKEVERLQRIDEDLASSDRSHSQNREISLKSKFGGASPLSVTIGEKSKPKPSLSAYDLLRMKKKLGLSGVKTKQLAGMIRVGLKDRKAVDSGLAEALVESNRVLDELFTAEQVKVLTKTGEEEEKTLIYCKDVIELLAYLLEHRELEEISADYKLGLDGGQGSIKLTLSVMEKNEKVLTGRQSYAAGVGVKDHMSGSTNKLMVLALMHDAPENYQTVKLMMDKVQIENFPATITSDIKMLQLLIGKCGGNLTHGCVFCSAAKPLTEIGDLYKLSDLKALHLQFEEAGADKTKQRLFQNVVNKPLLDLEPDNLILGPVAPPELHLMLGVADKGKKLLEMTVFETEEAGKNFIDQFLDQQNISSKGYRDSRSLEGNQTRKFLKSTQKLREAYEEVGEEERQKAEPIINILEIFSDVVTKCFGRKLEPGYQDALQRFSSAYMKLNKEQPKIFTVTPKIHIVMFHVQQYLEMMNTELSEDQEYRGLGYMSEQAFEAVHSDMKRQWELRKVGSNHSNFREKLRQFVVAYNSNNL